MQTAKFYSSIFDATLKKMMLIGNKKAFFVQIFSSYPRLKNSIKHLIYQQKTHFSKKISANLASIQQKLKLYFDGKRRKFKTPFYCSWLSIPKHHAKMASSA